MAVPETIQPLVDKYTFHRDEVTNLEHEMTMLQRKIEAMDGAIDKMVSELYELTQEEIRIVNGAS